MKDYKKTTPNKIAMKKFKIIFLLLAITLSANAQDVAWLNTIGGTSFEVASKIVTDTSNNVYVLGEFGETVDVNSVTEVYELIHIVPDYK